jgi:hypothetical protein
MLGMLVSLLILVLICAIVWWILSMIPIPAQFRWIVNVIFAIIVLICIISMLTGNLSFGGFSHPYLR